MSRQTSVRCDYFPAFYDYFRSIEWITFGETFNSYSMKTLFAPYNKHGLSLKNHMVMAPMTRSRALGNIPNDLMATYYGQRAGVGLIITEGTAPAPEGLGYPRIPGIFSSAQTEAWKKVVAAIHANGTKVFMQLMHTGRVGHPANLPAEVVLRGVSSLKAAGQIWTDAEGMQDYGVPVPFTTTEVKEVVQQHIVAAKNAVTAGFDGVELHGANGYLMEQFLHPVVNDRTDAYGGSIEKRAAFVLEVVKGIADAIGKEKVGLRISPYNTYNDLSLYDAAEVQRTYEYLAQKLNDIGIAYIHISTNAATTPQTLQTIRDAFRHTIILCNELTAESAEAALHAGIADLVAFGRPLLANPDFEKRIAAGAPLNQADFSTAFTPGEKGYLDYPLLQPIAQVS